MFKLVEQVKITRDFKDMKSNMIDLYKKYPQAEFYGIAEHVNFDDGEERKVEGRIIFAMHKRLVIHNNPWSEDGDYHANFNRKGHGPDWLTPRGYCDNIREEDFLWVGHEEIRHIEMRYTPTSNKEAAGALERYDS